MSGYTRIQEEEPVTYDYTEFTGEELTDKLGGEGFSKGLTLLEEVKEEFPDRGVQEGIKLVKGYLDKKDSLPKVEYVKGLIGDLYDTIGYWYDVKWLATIGTEEHILEHAVEFLEDVVYAEKTVFVEDYVKACMVGEELLECVSTLTKYGKAGVTALLRVKRQEVVVKRLQMVGITKDSILSKSPLEVSSILQSNTATVGKRNKRKQVSDELAKKGQGILGLTLDKVEEVVFMAKQYTSVYKLVRPHNISQNGEKVLNRFKDLETKRALTEGESFTRGTYVLGSGVIVYTTKKMCVVIGSHVTLFTGKERQPRYQKRVHDVRIKDLEKIVNTI